MRIYAGRNVCAAANDFVDNYSTVLRKFCNSKDLYALYTAAALTSLLTSFKLQTKKHFANQVVRDGIFVSFIQNSNVHCTSLDIWHIFRAQNE